MTDDTGIGGSNERFPPTRHSAIIALRSTNDTDRDRAMATVIESYWRPVYKYLRIRWSKDPESAKDLTQSFFLALIERETLAGYDPLKARFRTFLRVCLDRLVTQSDRDAARLKRGGGAVHMSLDYDAIELELAGVGAAASLEADAYFEHEWVRNLLAQAVDALRLHCADQSKLIALRLFERYDLAQLDDADRPTYAELATEFEITPETVTNHLAYARRTFRRIVLDQIRSITANEQEFREEVRTVLGVDPP